ncbi:sugar transferase [soil metagenome]
MSRAVLPSTNAYRISSVARYRSPHAGLENETSAVAHQPLRLAWPLKLAWAIALTDVAAVVVALASAQAIRFGFDSLSRPDSYLDAGYLGLALIYALIWIGALWGFRSQERRVVGVGSTEFARVVNASFFAFGLLAVLALLLKVDIARGYLAVAFGFGVVLLVAGRLVWRAVMKSLRRKGRALTGAIIVGPRHEVSRVTNQLARNLRAGYRPIAACVTDTDGPVGDASDGLPRVSLEDLPRISVKTRTRAVMVAGELPGGRLEIQDLGWNLERSNIELILVSRLTDVAGPRMHWRAVEGLPMVHVDLPQYSGFAHAIKRLIDVTLSSIGLIALSPLFALVAIAVRLSSVGPVLFRQPRVGVEGRIFTMFKFRSMSVDAEELLASLREHSDGNGVMFKMKSDPRVTKVGAILRRYSLDELPQLWNVLIGDMSLIGPRPPLPAEVEQYTGSVHRRLLIRPGITGLWQVSGRSNLSWDESIKLDLNYVENWSVTSDLVLLLRTVKAVFKRDGAY